MNPSCWFPTACAVFQPRRRPVRGRAGRDDLPIKVDRLARGLGDIPRVDGQLVTSHVDELTARRFAEGRGHHPVEEPSLETIYTRYFHNTAQQTGGRHAA